MVHPTIVQHPDIDIVSEKSKSVIHFHIGYFTLFDHLVDTGLTEMDVSLQHQDIHKI
jgi:hypothetical protein